MEKCHNVRRCDTAAVSPECGDLLCKVTGRGLELQTKVIRSYLKISESQRRPLLAGPSHLRHFAECALTPRLVDVKLGHQHKGHKGRAGWLA